jgi:hypothetical protein
MLIIFIVFIQSALFALFHLHIRKLEEKGVSPHSIAGLQRYALIPALILFFVTYKKEYLVFLLEHPISFWLIGGIAFFWGVGQYVGYIVLNSASSLSMVNTINSFLEIPIMLAMSILINQDYPNFFILIALGLLALAIIIKPTQHKDNKRPLLKYSLFIIIALMLASQIGHAFDGAFYKNLLHLLRPQTILFAISIYILTSSLALNIIYLLPVFKKPTIEEKQIIKKYSIVAYTIPIIWFIASLPEGYSFSNLPLFTLSALGAFSFLIKMVSDLKNKRLVWSVHTALFATLMIASIVFSTLSLH